MALQPNIKYLIVNAKSGTVLDLSVLNQTTSTSLVACEIPLTVACNPWLGEQWRRQPEGAFRTIPPTFQAIHIVI